jgi:hypothetical protein
MTRSIWWTLGLLLACEGTETGNPIEDGNEAGGFSCEVASSEKLELDAASELGFSANDVLAFAGGTHQETLQWQTLRFGSYGPESGQGLLTLGIAPRGAKLVRYRNRGDIEIEGGCGAQLEIDADVTLKTSGGALDEQTTATLVAPRAGVATMRITFDPAKLDGTLTVAPPSGPGFDRGEWVTRVELGTQFTRYGLSGSLSPTFEVHTEDSVGMSAGSGPMATFGLPACDYGVPVPLETPGVVAMQARLEQHGSARFGDASATVAFTAESEVACEVVIDAFGPQAEPSYALTGKLLVKTSDGAIDGRWPVRVSAKPNSVGELVSAVSVELLASAPDALSLAERYGFARIDVSGYDSSSMTLNLSLGGEGWSGQVVVWGFTNAVCPSPQPGDQGTPGCPGAERTELARFDVR